MAGYLRRLTPYRRVGGYISGGSAAQPGSYPTTTSAVWSLDDLYLRRVGPLLDNYPNAAAAYSLRSLTSAYTGPVVTVRRSSDSAEANFTATEVSDGTLEAWCGAGDGLVKTLYDQSGHGRHASQSTATAQPKIVSSGVLVLQNGQPAIDFSSASTNFLQISDGGAFDGMRTGAFSYFACAKLDSRLRWQQIFGTSGSATDGEGSLGLQFVSNTANKFGPHNTFIAVTEVATLTLASDTSRMLVSMHRDGSGSGGGNGATVTLYATDSSVNVRQSSGTQAWTSQSGTAAFIGKQGDASQTGNDSWDGTIQELIIYPVDQSANRVAIEDNINDHYNVFDPTVLLLHMDGANGSTTFTDSSVNNFTVTASGDAAISTAQSKFGGASLVSGTLAGSNYLTVSGDPGGFGTGDFTVEAWFMQDGVSTTPTCRFFSPENHVSGGNRAYVYINVGKLQFAVYGTVFLASSTLTWNAGQWYHVAYSRSNGQLRAFRDGQLVAEVANSTNLASDSSWRVSADLADQYIDDLRITKGRALYTANFTPPTQAHPDPVPADPHFNSVSLLLPMDGADGSNTFVDKSLNAFAVTPSGDAAISTTQSKFGGASAAFDGSGDYLSVTSAVGPGDLGTGDFTIEMWSRLTSRDTTAPCLIGNYTTYTTGAFGLFAGHGSSTATKYQLAIGGAAFPAINSTASIAYGQWVHLALVRNGTTVTLYVDGVDSGQTSSSADLFGANGPMFIGSTGEGLSTTYINGYIDDLRITKGVARYTANFTPPTAPHPHL